MRPASGIFVELDLIKSNEEKEGPRRVKKGKFARDVKGTRGAAVLRRGESHSKR